MGSCQLLRGIFPERWVGLLSNEETLVAQSCCGPVDCSPPGSSIRAILQARALEWVAAPSCRASSRPRDATCISCTAGRFSPWSHQGSPNLLSESSPSSFQDCWGTALKEPRPNSTCAFTRVQKTWLHICLVSSIFSRKPEKWRALHPCWVPRQGGGDGGGVHSAESGRAAKVNTPLDGEKPLHYRGVCKHPGCRRTSLGANLSRSPFPLVDVFIARFAVEHLDILLFSWWVMTPYDPMCCSPPGSSVHGVLQGRIQEWVAVGFSRGSSQPRDGPWVSCTAGRFFTIRASRAAQCLGRKRPHLNPQWASGKAAF